METPTDMVSNDSPLPAWKVSEGSMNKETVRITLTKNLSFHYIYIYIYIYIYT